MAATIIAVVNGKGGVGKTTLSINIHNVIYNIKDEEKNERLGLDVLFMDADDQKSSVKFFVNRAEAKGIMVKKKLVEFPVVEYIAKDVKIEEHVNLVKKRHDFIIIDTKGAEADSTLEVMTIADIIIVPLSPYGFDKEALTDTLINLRKAKIHNNNKNMVVLVVFNKVDKAASVRNREGRTEVGNIIDSVFSKNGLTSADNGVFLCKTELTYKPAVYDGMSKGLTVFDSSKGKTLDPQIEYNQLLNEIQERYTQVNEKSKVAA
jgi:cellulose biosynthesis protein BcsQ